jgi:hypothetical protein
MVLNEGGEVCIVRRWTIFIVLAFVVGCAKPAPQPAEVYRVESHHASTGEWVLDRINNIDHTRVRFTLTCDFYQWGSNERVKGNTACDLIVGDTFIPKRLPSDAREFLDVWQNGDTMFITKGRGEERVHQQFSVKSAKILKTSDGS